MTRRDGFPRFSARTARRDDAVHRKPGSTPSESLGKTPVRSPQHLVGGRQKTLTMLHIACAFLPTRRNAEMISMGHYYNPLVCHG